MQDLNTTAIVVTYNSAACITDCLTALREAGAEVRIVDNASSDDTVTLVTERFPDLTLVANAVNVGFAAAVNQALAGVTTDTVLLLNPDCVLSAGTARGLVTTIRTQPLVGVTGPRLLGPDGRSVISAHPFESLLTVLASRFGGSLLPVGLRRLLCGNLRRLAYDACREGGLPVCVDWLSGACLAVRTSLLQRLGGLDEGYFMYYEDEELCWQARQAGAKVLFLPALQATHIGGASSSADPTQVWPHLYRSMLRYFALHHPGSYLLVRTAVLLRALLGVGWALVRSPLRPAAASARARAWVRIARVAATARTPLFQGRQSCAF
ncbi:glycosyltransferase family 2 protein [Streptomyces tailanensis]|uniref:glycosyltransferase family 2 protein n=1 Tax=Streptomyces tailanensis TaxID=2569858 RepID=UPI00155A8C62|nr:glycosyltransferase family 2 protein [Streptomyces tailanensis]